MRPSSLQLFPRNNNDSATVTIAGDVIVNHYHKVIYTLYKNGVLIDSTVDNLHYSGGKAAFLQQYSIHAEKSLYRFKMYIYKQQATEIMLADSICSGDVFLIDGQSNAVAALNGPGADPANVWVRSFGSENSTASICASDTSWGLGNGTVANNHLSIGVWAMRLGKIITDSTGIPVCFINGARNGTRIIEHLPYANHTDMNSNYGCMLYRTTKAGVATSVKGIFWYQGESDTDTSWMQYENRFNILYNAWQQDYPSVTGIYIIQTRPGCISSTKSLYHQQLRESLRRISLNYSLVSMIPTVGLPDFDGCHFRTVGYQQLSQRIYNLLCDNIYNKPTISGSDPPKILQAFYSNNSNTKISLVFDQAVAWPALMNGYDLKDYIYLNSSVLVTGGYASGDTINLLLSASSNADKISYLPGINYSGSNNVYMGPWLLNNNGLGVPSFFQIPVSNSLGINTSVTTLICNQDSILLSSDHTVQNAQWYLNGIPIVGATNAQYFAKTGGDYSLIMTDPDSLAMASNIITINDSTPPLPVVTSANGKISFCDGQSLTLICNQPAASYQWYFNGSPISNANQSAYYATVVGSYTIEVQRINGCKDASQLYKIKQYPIPPSSFMITNELDNCNDSLVTLTGPSGAGYSYQWNNDSTPITGAIGQTINTTNSGSYSLIVTGTNGCSSTSSNTNVPITSLLAHITALGNTKICLGSNVKLVATSGFGNTYQWFKNNLSIPGANQPIYFATATGNYQADIFNLYGCVSTSEVIRVTTNDCSITRMKNVSSNGLLLSPNPFTTAVRLRLPSIEDDVNYFFFELSDAHSHIVQTLTQSNLKSNGEVEFNTGQLACGIYFYRAFINNNIYFGKILKQ